MKRVDNWNTVEEKNVGEFTKLPVGAYVCKIIHAKGTTSKKGDEMLVLGLDIAQGEYTDYYRKLYKDDEKWRCNYYQLTENKDGTPSSYYKGLIGCIEKSNQGYKWAFDEQSLKGKLIGVIFGEEEYYKNDGSIGTSVKPFFVRSIDRLENASIPKKKTVDKNTNAYGNGFVQVDQSIEDDLPF